MLVRLLYASRSADVMTSDVIDAILATSRKTNPALGITGLLCHSGDIFMQVLEGGRDTVNALYRRICADARHKNVILLKYEEITERHFAGWTMGQVNMSRVNPSILLRYSPLPVLDPHTMSGKMLMALLDELMATASIVGRI